MNVIFRAFLTLLGLSAFGVPSPTGATIISGPITNPANSHNYVLLAAASWTASEAEAITLGGHLVTVNDGAEQGWVWATFGVDKGLWIGLSDAATEGTFVWSSGDPVTYTNWIAGEPNAAFPTEDYAHMQGPDGQWNDRRDSEGTVLYGVVELPEPSIGVLFALGLFALSRPLLRA